MKFVMRTSALALVAVAAPAFAGEEILYQPAPAWVKVAELPPATEKQGFPVRLLEQQARLENGRVWAYVDTAVALDSPEALTAVGTISAQWFPDKGDLIIHDVELIRDGKPVDVLAGGAKFDVLHREQALERRILDGMLTATMALPGARVGDVVRMRYSTTISDQALKDHMQWTNFLVAEPVPMAKGRIVASWPSDSNVRYRVKAQSDVGAIEQRGGYNWFTATLPIEKPKDMPQDAPMRFRMPPLVQFSSFASFAELSAAMAPLFSTKGALETTPDVAAQVAKIAATSNDPLVRAAMATRIVQDDISYLLNGMNGGNYIPQTVSETWEKRYGDCKAKSLLLLAMLRGLGIEADAVLAQAEIGDVVAEMLPAPSDFNHVLVRATIGGETYWLDGTSSGTRLENIADVPRFGFGLPMVEGKGSELVAFIARPLAVPTEAVKVTIDQSAGVAMPAIFEIKARLHGAAAAPWKAISQMQEVKQRDDSIDMIAWNVVGEAQVLERTATFDDESGIAEISLRGLMATPWVGEYGVYEIEVPFQLASGFNFNNDRARKEWRDIPVIVNGPLYRTREIEWLLPEGTFRLKGEAGLESEIAGNAISSKASLTSGKFELSQSVRTSIWELPASELSAAKRESTQLVRSLPRLEAPRDARRFWQYRGKDRKLLVPIEKFYDQLISKQRPDDSEGYSDRAAFRAMTGDYGGALKDIDSALAVQADADLYERRAFARLQLGDLEGALADYETVENLKADGGTHFVRIEILGLLGRREDGIALADEFALVADEAESAEFMRAHALGWAGKAEEGLRVLQGLAADKQQDGSLLNGVCWHAGIWDLVDNTILAQCSEAVEKVRNSAAARDSRALALYRMGRAADALADLNAVLDAAPDQLESRYLRGVVRLGIGDKAGQQDIDDALGAMPSLKQTYGAYGLKAT